MTDNTYSQMFEGVLDRLQAMNTLYAEVSAEAMVLRAQAAKDEGLMGAQDLAIGALREENDKWRAAYANSDKPCVYCDLSAAEMARCPSGFPGCGRADDQMMCPHFAAEYGMEQQLADVRAALEGMRPAGSALDAAVLNGLIDKALGLIQQVA